MTENLYSHYHSILTAAVLEYGGVLIAVLLDLISGVRKAHRENLPCRSRGLRRTVSKLTSYYLALFCLSVVDVMIIVSLTYLLSVGMTSVHPFPYLTTAGAVSLALIELQSIIENSPHPVPVTDTIRKLIVKLFGK